MFLNDLSENPNIHPALQGILHSGVFLVSNPLNSFVCVRIFPPKKVTRRFFQPHLLQKDHQSLHLYSRKMEFYRIALQSKPCFTAPWGSDNPRIKKKLREGMLFLSFQPQRRFGVTVALKSWESCGGTPGNGHG